MSTDDHQYSLFGTDPRRLARRTDPSTSHAAAASTNSARWERIVLGVITTFGKRGCIQDDVITAITRSYGPVPYSTITARFKALEEKNLIRYTDEKRTGRSGRSSRVRVAVSALGEHR